MVGKIEQYILKKIIKEEVIVQAGYTQYESKNMKILHTISKKEFLKLMDECNLHSIIRLPGSIFAPYTSIATNLLFFDKTGPTKETWFYRMDLPVEYKAFSKTKPVELKHMQPIIDWWNNRIEIKDLKDDESLTETYKSKKFTIEELSNLNYNLDQCGYPVKEDIILSPKETMNNFINKRESLEKQLDEKLTEIIKLIGDVK